MTKEESKKNQSKEWLAYYERLAQWKERYKGKMDTMDAGMSRPNKPNYFKANND